MLTRPIQFCFLAMLLPVSLAHGQRFITEDTTFDGGGPNPVLIVNPAGDLIVSHLTNNPLLTMTNGATSSGIQDLYLGFNAGESGRLLIEGGSIFRNEGDAYVGNDGIAHGVATITGAGTVWNNITGLSVESGELNILNGATINTGLTGGFLSPVYAADVIYGGKALVSGSNSAWNIKGLLQVGHSGTSGELRIENGGYLSTTSLVGPFSVLSGIGLFSGQGVATVTGEGSTLDYGYLAIGHQSGSIGELKIEDGGKVTALFDFSAPTPTLMRIGANGAHGTVSVSGSGSLLESIDLGVGGGSTYYSGGGGGQGFLNVDDGGKVQSRATAVGIRTDGAGTVRISGAGSELSTRILTVGGPVGSSGLVVVGSGSTLNVEDTTTIAAGTGEIRFEGGSMSLAGGSGTMTVNGQLSGAGMIDGNVLLSGIMAPGNSPGTLELTGDLNWLEGAGMTFDLGLDASSSDLLLVGGQFSLDATLGNFSFLDNGWQVGQTYDLIEFGSTNLANLDAFRWTNDGAFDGVFALNGNRLQFTLTAVPEPGSGMLVLMVSAIGFLLRRRGL